LVGLHERIAGMFAGRVRSKVDAACLVNRLLIDEELAPRPHVEYVLLLRRSRRRKEQHRQQRWKEQAFFDCGHASLKYEFVAKSHNTEPLHEMLA
jgi:hypothetical protein